MLHNILLGASTGPYGVVTLSDVTVYTFNADALLTVDNNKTYTGGTWLTGGDVSYYEVKLVKLSGSNTVGASLNTWLSCSSDYTWRLVKPALGDIKYFEGTLYIRRVGETVEEDSCPVSLTSDNL